MTAQRGRSSSLVQFEITCTTGGFASGGGSRTRKRVPSRLTAYCSTFSSTGWTWPPRHERREGLALDQLEDQGVNAGVVLESVDVRNVGMIERRERLRLALERVLPQFAPHGRSEHLQDAPEVALHQHAERPSA